MIKERLGVFGGTFSPPHKGHFQAAKAFLDELELDRLLIIPAYKPPHKEIDGSVSAEERIEMCRIAFSSLEKAEISDIELKREEKSYTYQTLEQLSADGREIYLLVGTDMFLTLGGWKNPDLIFSRCIVCYIRRENDDLDAEIREKTELYKSIYGAKILKINGDVLEISSTELRERIPSGDTVREYLSDGVVDFIKKKGLYK